MGLSAINRQYPGLSDWQNEYLIRAHYRADNDSEGVLRELVEANKWVTECVGFKVPLDT